MVEETRGQEEQVTRLMEFCVAGITGVHVHSYTNGMVLLRVGSDGEMERLRGSNERGKAQALVLI